MPGLSTRVFATGKVKQGTPSQQGTLLLYNPSSSTT